ncbi:hypothetical protein tb265_06920 [Gemmatimonadetes bacterium T265]|nr:hypothetical protein tb265_06920 [Gemmatimonadetes bacterium T265]
MSWWHEQAVEGKLHMIETELRLQRERAAGPASGKATSIGGGLLAGVLGLVVLGLFLGNDPFTALLLTGLLLALVLGVRGAFRLATGAAKRERAERAERAARAQQAEQARPPASHAYP